VIRWWRRRSLRARLVLIGTFGLAAGFLAGGLALFAVLGLTLQRTVDDAALSTARDVATLAAAGQLPDPVPVAGGQVVQVVDAEGRVRYASIGADRLVSLLRASELPAARNGKRMYVDGSRASVEGPIRVVLLASLPPLGPGRHQIRYRNAHRADIGVYLANALVPASDRVAINGQQRDAAQRELIVDYELRPSRPGSGALPFAASLGVAVLVLGALWWRRRSA